MRKRNKSNLIPKKIENDKYYTPAYLSERCVSILFDFLKNPDSFSYLDPCAGDGAFSSLLPSCEAYDIEPASDGIQKADFLSLDINYKRGRVTLGNPPYGSRLNSAVKFYKKSVQISDYVAFLLPHSQLNNNNMFYEFDLVHSEYLGKHLFSGSTPVSCVFNIYKRPDSGVINLKPESKQWRKKLKDITISEVRVKNKTITDYDLRICAWGSVGKPILDGENYAKELYIKVNREDIKDQVLSLIAQADWVKMYDMKGVYNLAQWHVIKYLVSNIQGLS